MRRTPAADEDLESLRVAVVAASPLIRAGLCAALEADVGVEVIVEAAEWRVVADATTHEPIDVVIVDVGPVGAGDVVEPIDLDAASHGRAAIVALVDPRSASIGALLRDGVSAIAKTATPEQIVAAARAAAAGLVATSGTLLLRSSLLRPADLDTEPHEDLTHREREVLVQLSHGLGNRAIAEALHISPHTAKFHVAQILAKLAAASRAEAVSKAFRAGLVDL